MYLLNLSLRHKNYIILWRKKQGKFYLYKYIFWLNINLKIYKNTYKIFSWLKPIRLKRSIGKHNIIKAKILKNIEENTKLTIQKINIYQTMLKKAVE